MEKIKVGCLYEIDHSKLPSHTPQHLKSIRVVMVSEQAVHKVSVIFPSLESLETHLSEESHGNPDGLKKVLPSLDEKYSMVPEMASEVLCRRIPNREIAERSNTRRFWAVRSGFETGKTPLSKCGSLEIRLTGMVQWGKRKRVRYEYHARDEEEQPEEAQKSKRNNTQKQGNQIVVHSQRDTRSVQAYVGRWTARRYKLAEENLWKVMKAKGVCAANPILREPLRLEARKLIGDTGLLDHLLRQIAGKVAPGGADRFQRRHNTDGALEYWLESADLDNIRKEAGVDDPYWTPPPGWKPGDDPTQNPVCARMLKELWEEILSMKRERGLKQQDDLAGPATTSNSSLTILNKSQAYGSVVHRADMYAEIAFKASKIEQQMLQVSESYDVIEEGIRLLLEQMKALKPNMEVSLLMSDIEKETPVQMGSTTEAIMEDRATRIEKLRSNFRICKPQGILSWPNMSTVSPNSLVQQIDPFPISTPPSVNSSNKPESQLVLQDKHIHGSLVKPLAIRRGVSTSSNGTISQPSLPPLFTPSPHKTSSLSRIDSSSIAHETFHIDLNESPDAYNTSSGSTSETLTYQIRHDQNMVKAKNKMEHDADARKDRVDLTMYKSQQQPQRCCASFYCYTGG